MKDSSILIQYDSDALARRAKNDGLFKKLSALYSGIPAVKCGDCGTVCCVASPDFYLLEYLHARRYVRTAFDDPGIEAGIVERSVRWAFLSFFAEDTFCPFLHEGRCLIYNVRPYNCRVWALEDDVFYDEKAQRARTSLNKQEQFFAVHGVSPIKPLEEYVLPKCRCIEIDGGRHLTQGEIAETDRRITDLHRLMLKPEQSGRLNFYLHFPGHLVTKAVDPLEFDATRVAIAKEHLEKGSSELLNSITAKFGGRIP